MAKDKEEKIEDKVKEKASKKKEQSKQDDNKTEIGFSIPDVIRYSTVDTINNVLKKINDEHELKRTEKKVKKISIYDTSIFKAYKRLKKNRKKDIVDNLTGFNPEKTIRVALLIIFVFSLIFAVITIRLNSV